MPVARALVMAIALAAFVMLISSGPGTRYGLWPWETGLALLKWAAYTGICGAIGAVGLIVLLAVPKWRARPWIPVLALCIALAAAAPPIILLEQAKSVPPIHDISTDVFDPPGFVALAADLAKLEKVPTAPITTLLLKKGLRNVWMRGTRPLNPGQPRLVGKAFTLRFVPAREDLATPESWSRPISTRAAIEAMPSGCIAVADAMGVTDAGIFGDILCARIAKRGVKALITDGVVRDVAGVRATGLPVWCHGAAAPPSGAGLTFVNRGEPIGCCGRG